MQQCVYLRSRVRSFASTVRDRPRALTCVRMRLRTYIYIYIYIYTVRSRACSGSSGTTVAGRFQPNHIFCSRTHRCTAGSAPAPARLRTCRDQLDPRSESPLARSTSYASLDHSFARIVCAYIDIRSSVRTCAHIHVYAHALVSA